MKIRLIKEIIFTKKRERSIYNGFVLAKLSFFSILITLLLWRESLNTLYRRIKYETIYKP